MSRTPPSDDKRIGKSRKPASPSLAWRLPRRSPNEAPIQKGQLGQTIRLRERAERQGR